MQLFCSGDVGSPCIVRLLVSSFTPAANAAPAGVDRPLRPAAQLDETQQVCPTIQAIPPSLPWQARTRRSRASAASATHGSRWSTMRWTVRWPAAARYGARSSGRCGWKGRLRHAQILPEVVCPSLQTEVPSRKPCPLAHQPAYGPIPRPRHPLPRVLQWDGDSGPRPGNGSDIRQQDTTFTQYIRPFAAKLAAEPASTVPGCTPRASLAPAPLPSLAGVPAAVPAAEAQTQTMRMVTTPSPASPASQSLATPRPPPSSPSPAEPLPSVQLFEGAPFGSTGYGRKLLRD